MISILQKTGNKPGKGSSTVSGVNVETNRIVAVRTVEMLACGRPAAV